MIVAFAVNLIIAPVLLIRHIVEQESTACSTVVVVDRISI